MLRNGERQVAPDVTGIRRDHVARYEYASRLLGRGARVIDLACGVGYGAAVMAQAGGHQVLAIDRNPEAVAYGQQHYSAGGLVQFRCADATKLALDGEFDAAVCFETIEHVEDPLPMLRELHKAAPRLIASVPNEEVFPHGGNVKFHYRHYTRAEFEALLREAGYKVTAWLGQAGPFSEVESEVNGRTLIAVAERDVVAVAKSPEKAAPAHVSIVGLGISSYAFFEMMCRQGGVSSYCDEVWGVNAIGDVLKCDRVIHMDDVLVQERRGEANPTGNIAAMVNWLKTHPGPIYTSVVRDGYPGLVAFPLEEVLNADYDNSGGTPYFNSTVAYAVALAIHIGVKRISLFGVDFTRPNRHNAEQGRACVEYWLGIAAARGIEITVPEKSSLLDGCAPPAERLYGYDCVDVALSNREDGSIAVTMTPKDGPTAQEIEARYDHSKHPNRLMATVA